ncbi:MAG: MBL fold metallo-hydrolase [Deltaproteobacteria bacterium]|nr:MAG: MBL fold metallo-hydrolase [Deltaproteobacteria bacterium]
MTISPPPTIARRDSNGRRSSAARPGARHEPLRRILWALLAVAVAVAAVGTLALRSPRVQDAIVARIARRRIGRDMWGLLAPDALRVLLCGTSSPIPSPRRAEACTAVFAGRRMWIVDTGPGSWRTLALRRVRGEAIGAVFYTHLHSDHIGELGEFNLQTWVAGRPGPLRVYGPDGVTDLVHGFAQAYAADTRFRVAHHGAELLPPDRAAMIPIPVLLDGAEAARVLDEDGVVVSAFAVAHDPVKPAFGYRFDYGGRSVVVSGDTRPCPNLVKQARGADVLVHEAQENRLVHIMEQAARQSGESRVAKILGDIPAYHTTPADAAREAVEAGVRLLVLTHFTPPPDNVLLARIFRRAVNEVPPHGLVLGEDGTLIVLPTGSDAVRVTRLDP